MTTTANFGWTTPDPTDPIADGAAAIDALADEIDAALYTAAPLAWHIGNRNPAGADDSSPHNTSDHPISFNGTESENLNGLLVASGDWVEVQADVLVRIEAGCMWDQNNSGTRILSIDIGGDKIASERDTATGDGNVYQVVSRTVALSEGDRIEIHAYQNSGSSLIILAERRTFRAIKVLALL